MAARRSDSFFIRKAVNIEKDGAFHEGEIDLGAFVDALGEAVLRIHNIAVTFSKENGQSDLVAASNSAYATFQLTTQSQTATVNASNKSVVATGYINGVNNLSGGAEHPQVYQDLDVLPQLWTNGYLVAVETMYLGGVATSQWSNDVYVTVVMECTSEKMTKAAGLALALSQQ